VIYGVETVFILGTALLASALHVYYRDIRYLVESGLVVLFWLTPILYPADVVRHSVPELVYRVYILNPLAGCISAARRAILDGTGPDPESFGVAIVMSITVFAMGVAVFQVLQKQFADYT
jgi:ABC-type polysaccharide/polyol phosphate export permease